MSKTLNVFSLFKWVVRRRNLLLLEKPPCNSQGTSLYAIMSVELLLHLLLEASLEVATQSSSADTKESLKTPREPKQLGRSTLWRKHLPCFSKSLDSQMKSVVKGS